MALSQKARQEIEKVLRPIRESVHSSTVSQYKKERNRILGSIRRLERQGYVVSDKALPRIPKAITQQSVSRLKKITTQKLKEQSDFVDLATGQLVNPTKEIKQSNIRSTRGVPITTVREDTVNRIINHYRSHGNPANLQHLGNTKNLIHKGNVANLVHKGNIENLQHKGNPDNLQHKGRKKGSKNKVQGATRKSGTRKGGNPKGNPQNLTHTGRKKGSKDKQPRKPRTPKEHITELDNEITPSNLIDEVFDGTAENEYEETIEPAQEQEPSYIEVDNYVIDPDTGEIIEYKNDTEPRTDKALTPISFADVVISNYKSNIIKFTSSQFVKGGMDEHGNVLLTWVDALIAQTDKETVALMLQYAAEAGLILTFEIVYDGEKLAKYMSDMLAYLQNINAITRDDVELATNMISKLGESWEDFEV